jgi:hypothetical protein
MSDEVQRQQRLTKRAEALRKNLQRRKAQQNQQVAPKPEPDRKDKNGQH